MFQKYITSIFKPFNEKVCDKCESKDVVYGIYTRAYNDLLGQAAGESGYYCMECGHISFRTPDFEEWLSKQLAWIVEKMGDAWR